MLILAMIVGMMREELNLDTVYGHDLASARVIGGFFYMTVCA